jgi:hypothetical protein
MAHPEKQTIGFMSLSQWLSVLKKEAPLETASGARNFYSLHVHTQRSGRTKSRGPTRRRYFTLRRSGNAGFSPEQIG